MRKEFKNLFNSGAKSAVLLVLSELRDPVCLNELAELSECSVCATDAAMKSLSAKKLVRRKKRGNETVFTLNRGNRRAEIVESIRGRLESEMIEARARRYGDRPLEALQFASTTASFLSRVRALNENS